MERLPHQIVGSAEWGIHQHNKNIARGATSTLSFDIPKNTNDHPSEEERISMNKESNLIDNIVGWTNHHEWAQFDGGENDGKWVNPKYPDKIFNSGSIYERKTQEKTYFPISDLHEDPHGLALHYRLTPSGMRYEIKHNGFQRYGNPRQQRQWNYRASHNEARKLWNQKQAELEKEAIESDRISKYGPDKAAALDKQDKRKKELQERHTPPVSPIRHRSKSSRPATQTISPSEAKTDDNDNSDSVPLFTGPTPSEQAS
jgi:hypothetical protein